MHEAVMTIGGEPTILTGVSDGMRIVDEEQFGPPCTRPRTGSRPSTPAGWKKTIRGG